MMNIALALLLCTFAIGHPLDDPNAETAQVPQEADPSENDVLQQQENPAEEKVTNGPDVGTTEGKLEIEETPSVITDNPPLEQFLEKDKPQVESTTTVTSVTEAKPTEKPESFETIKPQKTDHHKPTLPPKVDLKPTVPSKVHQKPTAPSKIDPKPTAPSKVHQKPTVPSKVDLKPIGSPITPETPETNYEKSPDETTEIPSEDENTLLPPDGAQVFKFSINIIHQKPDFFDDTYDILEGANDFHSGGLDYTYDDPSADHFMNLPTSYGQDFAPVIQSQENIPPLIKKLLSFTFPAMLHDTGVKPRQKIESLLIVGESPEVSGQTSPFLGQKNNEVMIEIGRFFAPTNTQGTQELNLYPIIRSIVDLNHLVDRQPDTPTDDWSQYSDQKANDEEIGVDEIGSPSLASGKELSNQNEKPTGFREYSYEDYIPYSPNYHHAFFMNPDEYNFMEQNNRPVFQNFN